MEELQQKVEHINNVLEKFLPVEEGQQRIIFEAMNYSVRAGGKRLRPILMEETYHMFGGSSAVIEPFMAAIEMIHTYSLVHDDLPAMDNDEYRRGKKTTHAVYGEAMGILAGDALLNLAYETAAKAFDMEVADTRVARAFAVLAKKAGVYGLVGGLKAHEGVGDFAGDVGDGSQHALAAVALRILVAKLESLAHARGGAGRHGGAAHGAAFEPDFGFNGRIAAAVENFTADHINNCAHLLSFRLDEKGMSRKEDSRGSTTLRANRGHIEIFYPLIVSSRKGRAFTRRSISTRLSRSSRMRPSGTRLGPSLLAEAGVGWVSMKRPETPAATAARASTGTNWR